ncbi:TetR/AcrR family transcriptional regulator [Demequina sp.]|uniref:TetR/AcrR family transcriptional regulator n=1 Tax=Demequina sp. TaxID=2050685 RepID=UPI003D11B71C
MVATRTVRAKPLSAQERRESILDAAVPLFMTSGADVTTRQIADAAGIAEGTIFRVFEDKDAIVDAAVARFMDPTPTLHRLAEIDHSLDLEATVVAMIDILRERIAGVMGIMQAVGMRKHPAHPPRSDGDLANSVAVSVLRRHESQLGVSPEEAISLIRAAVFGSTVVPFAGAPTVTTEVLAHLIVNGIGKA